MSSELGVERPTSLALTESQVVERRVHFSDVERHHHLVTPAARHSTSTATISPRKSRPDPDFKPKRKRSMSFSSAGEHRFGHRWRYKRMPVLPYKFLLGGNITDPLNLGSLDKEDATPSGAETSSVSGGGGGGGVSRRSAAVRVIIPPNINDPLNLDASSDNEELHTDALQRQLRRRRRRKRKRRLSEPVDGNAGHDDEMTLVMEEQAGASCVSPNRTPQITLKPLTINTDLFSPPAPPAASDTRRDSVGSQPVTPTGSKPGPTTTTTTTTITATTPTTPTTIQRQPPALKKQRHKSDNKIVSPVIPQAGDRKRHPSHSRHHSERPHLSQQNLQPPRKYNPKNELFQFGNYNKYYGYRNPDQTPDVRLQHLKREWFEGRDVLDIGCNIGHVSLTVARDFKPRKVVGIDIDKKLVNIAQKNIKHYVRMGDAEEVNFPKSMRLLYGPLRPPVQADGVRSFPHNIKFVHGNYVLESDELLETVKPEFDLVLCLSITKWIHLNWGDAGLKRFFRRIFYNLRPGGRLVLEPQAWPSYNKRRKLTQRIFENYKSICLFPDKFNDFLLHEVGFSTSEKLVTPNHSSRGFQRPIIIYTKAGGSTKASPEGEGTTTTTTATTTTTTTTATTTRTDSVCDDEVFYPAATGDSEKHDTKDLKRGQKRRREGSDEEPESPRHIRHTQKQAKDACKSPTHTQRNTETIAHSDKQTPHITTTSGQVSEEVPEIRQTQKRQEKDRDICKPSHTQHNPETVLHSDKTTPPNPTTTSGQVSEEDPEIKPVHSKDLCTSTHTQHNPETIPPHSDKTTPPPNPTATKEEVMNVCDSSANVNKLDHISSSTARRACVNPSPTTSITTATTVPSTTTVISAKTTHTPTSPQQPEAAHTTKPTESETKAVGTCTQKQDTGSTCVDLKERTSVVLGPITTEIKPKECETKAVGTCTQKQDTESTSLSVVSGPVTTETGPTECKTKAVGMETHKRDSEITLTDIKESRSVVSTPKHSERDSVKRKAEECEDSEEVIKRVRLGNT